MIELFIYENSNHHKIINKIENGDDGECVKETTQP